MLQLFARQKDIELRLKEHEKWVFDVKVHCEGDWIFSAGWDKTIRMFSRRTGECIRKFEGHQENVWRILPLDRDTLLSTSDDMTARLWRVSTGDMLQTLKFERNAWTSEKLDGNHFVVGMISGKVHVFRRDAGRRAVLVYSFDAHDNGINDFSAWRNRLATASIDKTAKIWDANTFKGIATLSGNDASVRCVAMRDLYIATASWDNRMPVAIISVYNATNYQLLHKITTHRTYVRAIYLLGPKEYLLSSSDDGTTRVFDTSNGDILWTKKWGAGATSSAVFGDGRLVTGLSSGKVIVYNTPPNIARHMKFLEAHRTLRTSVDSPLLDAMISCTSGHSSPVTHCKNLIKYNMCCVSFEEWCSAHRILMLAVEDGDISRDTRYNDEHNWWFDELYFAVRDIELRNHEEYVRVKDYLSEAKACGVIECTEGILTARHLTKDLKETERTLQRAGIVIIERILDIENRFECLRETYVRYVRSQRKSQLVGIALQALPIAGGAVAGALSAGTEIVKGLSVKDVTDYALGLGTNIAAARVEAISDHILRQAADSLSPTSIHNLDPVRLGKLEEALRFCGLNVEMLQELFLERLKDSASSKITNEKDIGILTNAEDLDIEMLEERSHEEVNVQSTIHYEDVEVISACGEPKHVAGTGIQQYDRHNKEQVHDKSLAGAMGEPKPANITLNSIEEFSQEEIALFWAAYICRFNEKEQDKIELLRNCLLKTLETSEIHSQELLDARLISVDELVCIALEGLENRNVEITLGLRARLKRFLLDLRS